MGNGSTLRLISDIEGVKYTEGRFLPYFFPDTFHEGGDPVREAKVNWVTARRAILRKPIDRIGYGGYLKLALQFPEFVDYVESVCSEFRELYENIKGHHTLLRQAGGRAELLGQDAGLGLPHGAPRALPEGELQLPGVIEMLSGAPFDVKFISFEGTSRRTPPCWMSWMSSSMWAMPTPHTPAASGGRTRRSPPRSGSSSGTAAVSSAWVSPPVMPIRATSSSWPACWAWRKKNGFTLNYDKYNWEEHPDHFILEDADQPIDFGEGKKNIYAREGTEVLVQRNREVQMAAHDFGKGRAVYISGVYRIVLPTAAPFTVPFCGVPTARMSCTLGSVQLQCGSPCLCKKWQVLRCEQHLRAAGYHSLYD